MQILKHLAGRAKSKRKANKKLVQTLKQSKEKKVDELFHTAHDEVFEYTDCLTCANCCKTTSPVFTYNDVARISKFLKLKPGSFIDTYLNVDEDKDLVLKSSPCPFLDSENYCSIYNARPKACSDYPHTNRKKQTQLLNLNLQNTEVCPAVFAMFEKIGKAVKGQGNRV
ncbi:MAG: YkgJ family cysteine cluster protein [Flavobacteriales bacterium]|nr:YkgJ family cysteine cluster protein [Flavobacteriales bacterium]